MLSGIKFDAPAESSAHRERERERDRESHSHSHRHHRSSSKKHSKSDKKHKDKKDKKDKKHKKHSKSSRKEEKRKKRRLDEEGAAAGRHDESSSSDSSSSSDDDHDERIRPAAPDVLASAPVPAAPAAPGQVRDSWMMPRVITPEERKAQIVKAAAAEEARAAEQRKADDEEAERKRIAAEGGLMGRHRLAAASGAAPQAAVTVGDGGAGWRAKALKRARERAEDEGKSAREVITNLLGEDALPGQQRHGGGDRYGTSARTNERRHDANSADFTSSFGEKRHPREDETTSMEMVETEEEIEARGGGSQAASSAPIVMPSRLPPTTRTDISHLMKRPAQTLSSPAPSPPLSSGSSSSGGSSWRDKLRKNLTGTAAPATPEGEVARMFSTPAGGTLSRQPPTPSPLPSPMPSPSPPPMPHDAMRFAGMHASGAAGPASAVQVTLSEREPSPASEGDISLPQFAAAFMPVGSPSPVASTPSPAPPAKSAAPAAAVPTGASTADLNKLSAQAQVAKLKRNMPLYEELQRKIADLKAQNTQAAAASQVARDATPEQHAQLHAQGAGLSAQAVPHDLSIDERLRLLRSEASSHGVQRTAAGHEIVVLSHDAHGRPLASGSAPTGPQRDPTMKNKRLAPNINESGERVAYFADDVKETTLRDLVEKEKLSRQTAALGLPPSAQQHDLDRDYAQSIMRDSSFKLANTDEQFDDADFSMSKYDRTTSIKNQRRSAADHEARARSQQIHQIHRHDSMIERCWYCLQGSKDILKSLILSIGVRCYLAIPRVNWITPGHCCILPIEHSLAQTQMEDDMAEEVQYFKKHLCAMFAARQMRCVFIETVYDLHRKRHTMIECIPLTVDQYQEAEMYFVKAIDESDDEWAQNKKLIRFTSEKGIRKAVPKNFNYFSVEFGLTDGGLAHTIEESASFPEQFGKEVLLGMLGESAQLFLRGRRAGATEETRRVKEFLETWRRFDWTQKLAGGSREKNAAAAAAAGNANATNTPAASNTR